VCFDNPEHRVNCAAPQTLKVDHYLIDRARIGSAVGAAYECPSWAG